MPWQEVDRGELRWSRQRLAPGLSRFRAEPGARIMPAHVHVDEEEWVVVLSGSGVSRHEDVAHPVRASDVVLHRPDTGTHTLIAGDGGLEVLIFASGSPTGLTRLPRAGVLRAGEGWWPYDVEDPFAAEPPLDPPAATAPLPPVGTEGDVSALRLVDLPPGETSGEPHFHTANSAKYVVLAGAGEARLGDERHPLGPGSIVVREPDSGVPHQLAGGPLTYLAWTTRVPGDCTVYEDRVRIGRHVEVRR